MRYLNEMLERHWPWLVSIVVPATAASLLVVWVTLAPRLLESSSNSPAAGYSFRARSDSREPSTRELVAATSVEALHSDAPSVKSANIEDYLLGVFDARDLDRSRSLDLNEFVSASNQERRRRLAALFRNVDLNGDGLVSANEYLEQLLALAVSPTPQ